jgi:flagellar basal-body rod modification protein FlgD
MIMPSPGNLRGAAAAGSDPRPAAGGDPLANKEVFLRLLVSQLQHQNPLQPADGLQFVSQLAQFSGLEQSLAMREDLAAIRRGIEALAGTGRARP